MKAEFSIEDIRRFNKKMFQSVSARYVKSAEKHIDYLKSQLEAKEKENKRLIKLCKDIYMDEGTELSEKMITEMEKLNLVGN